LYIVEEGYTLHVYSAGAREGYIHTLHVSFAYGGQWHILHVYTSCGVEKETGAE
jgi:hypothetical protein